MIDGITARVIGLDGGHVTTHPPVLALFPESAGRLTVSLELPSAYPAGRHPLTVEVFSRQDEVPAEYLDLDLLVPTRPDFRLHRPAGGGAGPSHRPVRADRDQFGQRAVDRELAAANQERAVTPRVMPERLLLDAGRSGEVLVEARGPRMIFGSTDRPITATVTAVPADPGSPGRSPSSARSMTPASRSPTPSAGADPPPWSPRTWRSRNCRCRFTADPAPAALDHPRDADGVHPAGDHRGLGGHLPVRPAAGVRHRPGDQVGTGVPFFPTDIALQAASDQQADANAPAGALPKDGSLPSGLGGTIAGTVIAASDGGPVGRILVEALRVRADGTLDTASSAATQGDGSIPRSPGCSRAATCCGSARTGSTRSSTRAPRTRPRPLRSSRRPPRSPPGRT